MSTKKKTGLGITLGITMALGLAACSPEGASDNDNAQAAGAEACSVLEGETVTIVVPYDPGGGYDSFARLIAPELSEAIGADQVIVENRPGAGGLAAVVEIVSAPTDGTRVAIMDGPGVAAASLADAQGANFDLDDLSYVGTVSDYPIVIASGAESDIQTIQDLAGAGDLRFASAGRGASDYITSALLGEIFELDHEIVTGFGGQSEAELSVIQGNVEVIAGVLDSRLDAVRSGDLNPLAVIAEETPEQLPEAPLLRDEVDLDDEALELLEAHQMIHQIGRPLVGPGEMDSDALTCLRDSLTTVAEDTEFTERAAEQGRIIKHIDGATMEEDLVFTADEMPDAYIEILKSSF